jgi:hypothetical protein
MRHTPGMNKYSGDTVYCSVCGSKSIVGLTDVP